MAQLEPTATCVLKTSRSYDVANQYQLELQALNKCMCVAIWATSAVTLIIQASHIMLRLSVLQVACIAQCCTDLLLLTEGFPTELRNAFHVSTAG